jgi:hypothetical protein
MYETSIENNLNQDVAIEYKISLDCLDIIGYFKKEPMLYNSKHELIPFEDTNPLPNLIAGIIPPNHCLVIAVSSNINYDLKNVNATANFNFIEGSLQWGENKVEINTNNFNQFFFKDNSSYQMAFSYSIDNN